ncbi:hypothetical protein [Streptomyces sp. NPDC001970]
MGAVPSVAGSGAPGRACRSPRRQRKQGQPVNITDDHTRLTLDTIALSGFGHRFQSFDEEELHPFLDALLGALTESLRRSPARMKTAVPAARPHSARFIEPAVRAGGRGGSQSRARGCDAWPSFTSVGQVGYDLRRRTGGR